MTTVLTEEPDSWTTPPGWGIFADLTPPELLNARRLKGIRRLLLLVLVGIVVIAAAVYGYARWQSHQAGALVVQENARTAQLQAEAATYAPVVQIQGSVAAVRAQLAQLMVGDTDFGALLNSVSQATPRGVSITTEQVTISSAGAAAGAAAAAVGSGGTSLDTSGIPQIGRITLGGTVTGLSGLASYITVLQGVHGVIDVVPGSTGLTGDVVTFSVTLSVTNALLSHHWDIAPTTAATTATTTTTVTTPATTTAP